MTSPPGKEQREDGGWRGKQSDGSWTTSYKVIDEAGRAELPFSDAQLRAMIANCSEYVIDRVPRLEYWECGENRKMCYPDNITGCVQRAFDFYWTIRHGVARGKIFYAPGAGGIVGPATFCSDRLCGEHSNPDHAGRYGNVHMQHDENNPLPFFDGLFAGVTANHVLEHLLNQEQAVHEWLRITEVTGYVCIVMPDITHNPRGHLDPTHTREFSADEFYEWLTALSLPAYKIVEFNTFDNNFSYNVVLQRMGE